MMPLFKEGSGIFWKSLVIVTLTLKLFNNFEPAKLPLETTNILLFWTELGFY